MEETNLNVQKEIFDLEVKIQENVAKIEQLDDLGSLTEDEEKLEQMVNEREELVKENKELTKRVKELKNSLINHSKFYYLPKGMKVHFILVAFFFFPILSWSVIPFWKLLCAFILTLLGNVLNNVASDYSFIYYVIIFLASTIISIVGLTVQFSVLKLRKQTEDKRTFNIFWWISLSLIIMMLIYQVWQMIVVIKG